MPQLQATGGQQTSITGGVSVESKSVFTVTGAVVGTTETSIAIPAGTKSFRLQAACSAGAARITVSHTIGGTGVAITSFDVAAGSHWKEDLLDGTGFTIYLKSSKAATDVQLVLWS